MNAHNANQIPYTMTDRWTLNAGHRNAEASNVDFSFQVIE
jgi:hypothetical protein